MRQRIIWIDWMKTISMFAIVFGHFTPNIGCDFIYSFSVPIFFIISGFLFSTGRDNFQHFMKKMMRTLVIPYLAMNFIMLSLLSLIRLVNGTFDIWGFMIQFSGIFLGGNNVDSMAICSGTKPTWFIYAIFLIRILFYFIVRSKNMKIYAFVVACVTLLLTIIFKYINLPNFAVLSGIIAIPFFELGLILREFVKKGAVDQLISRFKKNNIVFQISLPIVFLAVLIPLSNINGIVSIHAHTLGKYLSLSYLNAVIGTLGIFFLSVFLSDFKARIQETISVGTILILGFHANIVAVLWSVPCVHNLPFTILFSIIVLLFFIPLIKMVQKYIPWLIGR